MPEQIALINESVGRYALSFAKIFKGIIGIQAIRLDLEFLAVTRRVECQADPDRPLAAPTGSSAAGRGHWQRG